jgi:hypothetical protein
MIKESKIETVGDLKEFLKDVNDDEPIIALSENMPFAIQALSKGYVILHTEGYDFGTWCNYQDAFNLVSKQDCIIEIEHTWGD